MLVLTASEGFERFSVYGFSIEYPRDHRVEFNPKSRREGGDVVFHSPDRLKAFLSWGELEKATKSFPTAEKQAEHSLDTIKKTRNVRNFDVITQDRLTINAHEGVYSRVALEEMSVGLIPGKKGRPQEAFSLHVHCPESSRYFVVYSMFLKDYAADYTKTLMTMATSLKCH